MALKRTITAETLGGWVMKCNPRKTSVAPFRAAGEVRATWCVADNYRSRLIRPGDRALFWVTAHAQRGIWGAGRIVGEVSVDDGQAHVPVCIPLFAEPMTAAELSALPVVCSMEVFRSPQQANPSWVSAAEMVLLEPLMRSRAEMPR